MYRSYLLEHWSQPQCILDRSYPPDKSEKPNAIMYQPQQGMDSQLLELQHASTLANALERTLVAPRLYSPTVCTSCSRRNMSYYFKMGSAQDSGDAQDWHGTSLPVRAVVAVEQAESAEGEKRVWSYLAYSTGLATVAVPPHVRLPVLSLRTATNWLQRCNDETLFFDGLEENALPKTKAPAFSDSITHAYNAVRGLLKLPMRYTCANLNSRDSVEACACACGQGSAPRSAQCCRCTWA